MTSFFKSLLFAALRPFRKFIDWQDLELLFIQTCALNLLNDPNPPKYEEFAQEIGNQLSHSLLQQNRRVTKDQSATIFGSLNLICLHENLQRHLRELGSLMKDEQWDKAETTYTKSKITYQALGFAFIHCRL